jgi:hypothetical protein
MQIDQADRLAKVSVQNTPFRRIITFRYISAHTLSANVHAIMRACTPVAAGQRMRVAALGSGPRRGGRMSMRPCSTQKGAPAKGLRVPSHRTAEATLCHPKRLLRVLGMYAC